ncbi:MAG TPA: MOSC domain-containing protein [Pirellulaceae bacterium]|nr:MOSC domain-containing protein [Pirellulaceae bacterium]
MLAHLLSIQVAKPATYAREGAADPHDRPWRTGYFKKPVSGPVFASQTGLAGDGQADLENHGGIDKAVLAYSAEHYPIWREELKIAEMPYGGFGENLTIAGLDETGVCIGDVWQCGPVVFEVSQPRQPCWKTSRRWRIDDLSRRVIANGRSGWYLRVLTEGEIEAGLEITLVRRVHPQWTVARANEILHHRKDDLAAAEELANLPELALSWRELFLQRLKRAG